MDYADLCRKFSGRLNLIASVKLSKLPITIYTRSWQIKFWVNYMILSFDSLFLMNTAIVLKPLTQLAFNKTQLIRETCDYLRTKLSVYLLFNICDIYFHLFIFSYLSSEILACYCYFSVRE